MAHRKRKETKLQPSMLPGPAVPGCCLVSFHFLLAILCPQGVWVRSAVIEILILFMYSNLQGNHGGWHLGLVYYDLVIPTVCPILLEQLQIGQKLQRRWATYWNFKIKVNKM